MRKKIELLINGAIIVAPFLLLLLPIDYFDSGEVMCLSKRLANVECYGCGMSRAIMHLIHLDFQGAWAFNKLSFIVLPMLIPFWIKAIYEIQNKKLPGLLGRLM